ncbi:unnamed protein product [Ectocarpus sp. 12 AP-2014]|uniref:Uncharacterized protein n=1 Tax=Ectocarpus siliculosus TaxID=2880 RepID=D7FV45_ECTSI|nr:conserved unknown protein [Ectocarpus siliculosus]|eukprot:CBJ31851.1 conserved unknown protein [Ectocarpus siliculosus]
MAFKQLLALACLVASSLAFVTPMTTLRAPATTSARSTASARGGALMSCRVNAKKEKRTRNRLNMRKFNKRGTSRKKILRVERQERAAEDEAEFLAKVFHSGMDDWEEVDIFSE